MKIRTQLLLSALVSTGLIAALIVVIHVTSDEVIGQNEQRVASVQTLQAVYELDILAYEYIFHQEERAEQQWHIKYDVLKDTLTTLENSDEDEKSIANTLSNQYSTIGDIFSELVTSFENENTLIVNHASKKEVEVNTAIRNELVSQLLIASQLMVDNASALAEKNVAQLIVAQTHARSLSLIVGILVLIISIISSLLIVGYIGRSFKVLQHGAEMLGKGNFDYTINIESQNELGQIAKTFNAMSANLKKIIITKTDLEKEVAERKQAEEALLESEERWETTLASIGDGVIATDELGIITFINTVGEKLTGWSLDRAVGKPITEIYNVISEKSRENLDNPALLALKKKSVVMLTNHSVLIQKDLTEIPIDDSAAPIKNREGSIVGTVLVFRDISKRKNAENAKNDFISMLAHELRNPLAPLLLSMQKLKMYIQPNGEMVSRKEPLILSESVENALRQIFIMTRLLDDLLDVSRMEQGKIALQFEKIDLHRALNFSVASVRLLVDERKHKFTMSLPLEPIVIEADPVRFEQTVVNLLNNAAKYTDVGGKIHLSATRDKDFVEIRVRDTGKGISKDKLTHIFDPYYQIESKTQLYEGLGLGLMLIKNLITLHNGTIEVVSEGKEKGSEFIVRLPILQPGNTTLYEKQEETLSFKKTSPSNKKKILVVDDNQKLASLMRDLLVHFGHNVVIAHEGKSAFVKAQEFNPDIIFCDIGLPGMSGYEVASAIREAEKDSKKTLLVAVSGYGQQDDIEKALKAGFDHHLVKPASIDSLLRIIDG